MDLHSVFGQEKGKGLDQRLQRRHVHDGHVHEDDIEAAALLFSQFEISNMADLQPTFHLYQPMIADKERGDSPPPSPCPRASANPPPQ